MLIKYLQFRYVKARLNAYLDGDLPLKTRRFIARQIDENPLAYREYIRLKQTRQELERSLPVFGKADSGQLDALWANIQQELSQPEPIAQRTLRPVHYSLSYGVAMLLFVIIILTPFAIDAGRTGLSPVPQPFPESTADLTLASTPDANSRAIALAITTQEQVTGLPEIPLQNTPAPKTPGS